MCITAGQIQWTQDVTKALAMCKDRGDKRALKSLKKKQVLKRSDLKSKSLKPGILRPLLCFEILYCYSLS